MTLARHMSRRPAERQRRRPPRGIGYRHDYLSLIASPRSSKLNLNPPDNASGDVPSQAKIYCRLRHCQGMYQTVDLILGVMAAAATALLMGLIARDNIGMPPDMVREDTLIAASSCCRRRDVTRERKQ
jgi:hypothetical protein